MQVEKGSAGPLYNAKQIEFVEKLQGWLIRNFLSEYYKITGINESCQHES